MKLVDLREDKSQFFKTREQIQQWLHSMGITVAFTINEDLTVDVKGGVDLSLRDFTKFPVKFGKVTGDFMCNNNKKLKSLDGVPNYVGGRFSCSYCNELTSLHGSPLYVGIDFSCGGCSKLKSFAGITEKIGNDLYCNACDSLGTLKDIHKHIKSIGRDFACYDTTITGNILGLLKIKNLKSVELENQKLEAIINKYLPEGNILDCIDELIDAGFEEFAKL